MNQPEDRLQSPERNVEDIEASLCYSRHPELVSGSISPYSQAVIGALWMLKRVQHGGVSEFVRNRRKPETDRQINPLRVFRFNQVDLPRTMPVLQLLLSGDGRRHAIKYFKTHQSIHGISGRMTVRQVVAVLVQALDQIRGYANVECAVGIAREYIDAGLFRFSHGQYMAAQWTLKQVQGDGWRASGRY